jgi:hypothetical protein
MAYQSDVPFQRVNLYSKCEVAEMYRVALRQVDQWQHSGQLAYVVSEHAGKDVVRFRIEDLRAFRRRIRLRTFILRKRQQMPKSNDNRPALLVSADSGPVPVGMTPEDLADYLEAGRSGDSATAKRLVDQKRVIVTPSGTQALGPACGFFSKQVKLQSGPHRGVRGFAAAAAVQCR